MQLNVKAIADKVVTFFTGPKSIAFNASNPKEVLKVFSEIEYLLSKVLGAVIGDACRDSLKDLALAIRSKGKLKEAPKKEQPKEQPKTVEQPKEQPKQEPKKEQPKVSTETHPVKSTSGNSFKAFKVVEEKEPVEEKPKVTSSTTHKHIDEPKMPERPIDGSQQTDYENKLLGSVIEYCYRTFNNLGIDKGGLPDYYPRKTSVLGSYASLAVPDCWYDFSEENNKSWKSDESSRTACNDVYSAAYYLRAVTLKAIEEFMSGNMLIEMAVNSNKGQEIVDKATKDIHHAVTLFLTVSWPIIQGFKPKLQFKTHKTGQGKKIRDVPTETIQCFLSLSQAQPGNKQLFSINKASANVYGKKCIEKHITCQNLIDKVTFSISDEELDTARKQLMDEANEMHLFE